MIARFRPLLFMFLSLALGLYIGKLFYYVSPIIFYVILSIILLISILCFALFPFREKTFWCEFWENKWKALTVSICFLVGFGLFNLNYYNLDSNFESKNYVEYYAVGDVSQNYIVNGEVLSFYLENVSVTDGAMQLKLRNRLLVKVDVSGLNDNNEIFDLAPNDTVLFKGAIYNTPIFTEDYLNSYAYKNDYQHKAYASIDDLTISKGSLGIMDSVREKIRNMLDKNMAEREAHFAYAVLVGDSSLIDDETLQNFQDTGTAHILAVSGLHIGFLVLMLLFVLKKCRLKDKWQVLIVAIVLLLYCILCGWSVSVVRASVMAICLLLGKAFGKQTDSLSSLSFAGLILLLWQPLILFDLSFQLSFASVFGIIMLMPIFQNLFKKLPIKKFWDVLALSLSAQIATLPFLIGAFERLSVIGLIANIVVVPFFGYVYMLLFLVVVVSLILSFLSFLLWVVQWGLYVVNWLCEIFASVSFASLGIKPFAEWGMIGYTYAIFSISYNCVANKCYKIVALGVCSVVVVLAFIVNSILLAN